MAGNGKTHIGEHLRCEQRECSRNSRPNHGVDGKGRRGKHPTRTGLSTHDYNRSQKLTDMYPRGSPVTQLEISTCKQVALGGHTRNEMNMKLIDAPITIVLSAGTYQGTALYAPVHPSQKQPTTSKGAPTAAVYRRSSGGGKPRHSFIRILYLLRWSKKLTIAPIVVPIPTPRKISPSWLMVSP